MSASTPYYSLLVHTVGPPVPMVLVPYLQAVHIIMYNTYCSTSNKEPAETMSRGLSEARRCVGQDAIIFH